MISCARFQRSFVVLDSSVVVLFDCSGADRRRLGDPPARQSCISTVVSDPTVRCTHTVPVSPAVQPSEPPTVIIDAMRDDVAETPSEISEASEPNDLGESWPLQEGTPSHARQASRAPGPLQ
jgi:hypothetical protein